MDTYSSDSDNDSGSGSESGGSDNEDNDNNNNVNDHIINDNDDNDDNDDDDMNDNGDDDMNDNGDDDNDADSDDDESKSYPNTSANTSANNNASTDNRTQSQYSSSEEDDDDVDDNDNDDGNDNDDDDNDNDDDDNDDNDNDNDDEVGSQQSQQSYMVDQSFDSKYTMNQSFQTTNTTNTNNDNDNDNDGYGSSSSSDSSSSSSEKEEDPNDNNNNLSTYSSSSAYMTGSRNRDRDRDRDRLSMASNASSFASGLDTSMNTMEKSLLHDSDDDDDDNDDDDDDNNSDDDGSDDNDDEENSTSGTIPTNSTLAAAASGKVLIHPTFSDNSDSDDDDVDDDMNGDDDDDNNDDDNDSNDDNDNEDDDDNNDDNNNQEGQEKESSVTKTVNENQEGNEDDDDDDVATSNDNDNADEQQQQQLSGKTLSNMTSTTEVAADNDGDDDNDNNEDNESSSDDELLVTHKSKTSRKSTPSKKSSSASLTSTSKSSTKSKKLKLKTKSKKKGRKKRSKVSPVTAIATADIDDDDDAIEAVAVLDDGADANSDSDAVEAVIEAVVIPQEPPKKKRKKPGPKPKKRPKDEKKKSKRGSKGKKRRMGRTPTKNDSDTDESVYTASIIPQDRIRAAEQARDILVNSIQRTPFEMSESHTVRSFGRIKHEQGKNALDTLYSNATALYPVGFSCDRYEFSPVHGRFLKMRCDILDGNRTEDSSSKQENDANSQLAQDEKKLTTAGDKSKSKTKPKAGPIFRIMWGRGIDEIDDVQSFPYDLYSASPSIGNEVDAVAVPAGKDTVKIKPEQGMRVKVRFDTDDWYFGSILQVSVKKDVEGSSKKKTSTRGSTAKKEKKQRFNVQILYDDGVKENVTFPDADVVLVPPGADDIDGGSTVLMKQAKGRPVTTVTGKSPIEAWARALMKLGLIDEIIYEQSLESIADSRSEGLAELKGKLESTKRFRQDGRSRHKDKKEGKSNSGESPEDSVEGDSAREVQLRERVEKLLNQYETRLSESRATSTELAEARIQVLGPFLSNPFLDSDASLNQQKQWLSTIIKKEKSKIGSTGNKRKIVTATDLLERTATFYNIDIERLMEGLPGSEFCPGYVFHSLRGSGASALTWVHEEQIRQEREHQKRRKRIRESQIQEDQIREKEMKRKARDDEREMRKKQKLDEIDQVKRDREQTRLTRLSTQIDEKLFKESCVQRERVTFLATKLVGREITRRRKVAEIMVAHNIGNAPEILCQHDGTHHQQFSLLKHYSTDVLKVWNFMVSYKGAFDDKEGVRCVPELDELQDAISTLVDTGSKQSSRKKAIHLLTNIAIALCKPMNKGLIKTLSSVLATALQDNKVDKDEGESKSAVSVENDPDSFPINELTWREFARLIFLTDALNDLGYTKIEQTHITRGHRTGGHPNSKEAKRVKRGEDHALVLRRQALAEIDGTTSIKPFEIKVTIPTPCKPSAQPSDWIFFLHNIKSLPSNAATGMKSNLKRASTLLKAVPSDTFTSANVDKSTVTKDLQQNISMLDQIGTSITSSSETISICKKVRHNILKLLDKATGEILSVNKASSVVNRDFDSPTQKIEAKNSVQEGTIRRKNTRQKAGMYGELDLTEEAYKRFKASKEDYITAAIELMEERERKKKRGEDGNEDDDDDDDDEEEEEEGEKSNDTDDFKKEVDTNNEAEETNDTVDAKKEVDTNDTDDVKKEVDTNNEAEETNDTVDAKKEVDTINEDERIGKKTDYDKFCADEPKAPELIRRCLAVLRCLCLTSPAESFIYPVDPRKNMKYYDAVMKPMALYDIGKILQKESTRFRGMKYDENHVEDVVAQFARNVRLIGHNCTIFSSVGAAIISTAEEMIRIFERLFFDWILSPKNILPPLDMLDDDRCVVFHSSDEDSMVLLCDGCEGKFNMSRLEPPLKSVPKGDWYCPRCRTGYCWASVDCRIGRKVSRMTKCGSQQSTSVDSSENNLGVIQACLTNVPDGGGGKTGLTYIVRFGAGNEETWSLDKVDQALESMGDPVPKIRCLEAVAESPGYGCGLKNGLTLEAVPIPLNPLVSDTAAQQATTSTVFRDTIVSSAVLLVNDVDAITASEWLKILILLQMKCASTDTIQEFASKIENEAHIKGTSTISKEAKIKSIGDIIPKVTDDENEESEDENEESLQQNLQQPLKKDQSDDTSQQHPQLLINNTPKDPQHSIENEPQGDNASTPEENKSSTQEKIPNEEEILMNQRRKVVLLAMKERQKARENSILANYIKMQIKPALSSFEEDNVTQVINSYLSSNNNMEGVSFSSSRCRSMKCDLCGLSDMALATPLIRAPNHQEWLERMSFTCSGHKSFLVADLSGEASASKGAPMNGFTNNLQNVIADKVSSSENSKLAIVTVRVGGEVISMKERGLGSKGDEIGIVSFLPRNEKGFQSELNARYKDGLPFITGSLSAHESCALAAHKARMERVVQDDKEKAASIIDRDFGNTCGRSIALGNDEAGRWYWKFDAEPNSLFVSVGGDEQQNNFHRFSNPESIASVIKSLAKHPLAFGIRNAYPQASIVLNDGTWSNLLQRRGFEHLFNTLDGVKKDAQVEENKNIEESEVMDPYDEGEEVLVESSTGKLLWDARIVAVGKNSKGKITEYRVHYKEWSSRFDEWVEPKRVVEPNDTNVLAQEELAKTLSTEKTAVPFALHELQAKTFLESPHRARMISPIMDFSKILNKAASTPTDDHRLDLLRSATLIIEAALPEGAVDTSTKGSWNAEKSSYWRSLVMNAKSPGDLMGCIILLENVLSNDWLRPNAEHLLGCLPRPWKAINDATVSSVALRIWVLDRGIKYGLSHDEEGEWRTIDEEGKEEVKEEEEAEVEEEEEEADEEEEEEEADEEEDDDEEEEFE